MTSGTVGICNTSSVSVGNFDRVSVGNFEHIYLFLVKLWDVSYLETIVILQQFGLLVHNFVDGSEFPVYR